MDERRRLRTGNFNVMLSRATKLCDLTLVDVPRRECFESFLCDHNEKLVARMREFEAISGRSLEEAGKDIRDLGWADNTYVKATVLLRASADSSQPAAKRRRCVGKVRPAQ